MQLACYALAAFLARLFKRVTVIPGDMPLVVKLAANETVNGLEKMFHEE